MARPTSPRRMQMGNKAPAVLISLTAALILCLLPSASYANRNDARLVEAAAKGDVAELKTLLSKKADINSRDRHGATALMKAAGEGNTYIIKTLLTDGADVSAKDNEGKTALNYAVENGQ